jgi:hypothetical protein
VGITVGGAIVFGMTRLPPIDTWGLSGSSLGVIQIGGFLLAAFSIIAILVSIDELFKMMFGMTFPLNPLNLLAMGAGLAFFKTARCGRCNQQLGGKEYRYQLRHGHTICPYCGARMEGTLI